MQKKTTKALCLLSGGQDSTTCLYWAKKHFDEVHAIGFDYGQSHVKELEMAQVNAQEAGVSYKVVKLDNLLAGSSLLDKSISHNETHFVNPELPASFTPGRNALFLTLAASYAYLNNITDLITGVCQTDYSGYPDCRDEFIKSMELSLSKALDINLRIHTPLMFLTKAETWKLAKELGVLDVIVNNTMTDYNGDMTINDWGYGKPDNPATVLRMKGYFEAKQKGWI